jgi:molybdopterin converting factor small subunit
MAKEDHLLAAAIFLLVLVGFLSIFYVHYLKEEEKLKKDKTKQLIKELNEKLKQRKAKVKAE